MKRMHKLTALLLTLLLALMMTACGGTADDGGIDDGGFDDGTVDDGGFDGDVQTGGDYTGLAGDWYLDGDPGAESILLIAADGSWELYERPGGDGDPARVDSGALRDGGGAACTTPTPRSSRALPTICRWWMKEHCTGAASTTAICAPSKRR